MRFSVYYKIQNRYSFFTNFCRKNIKTCDKKLRESLEDSHEELMELIVMLILDENKDEISSILTKNNSKMSRIIFDHFTNSKTRNMKRSDVIDRVDEFFHKEKDRMKNIREYIKENVKPIKFDDLSFSPIKLITEDDEMDMDSPMDDAPMGGDFDDDGFDGRPDSSPFGDIDDEPSSDGGEPEDTEEEDNGEVDLSLYEDDPDFQSTTPDSDSLVTPKTPPKMKYDSEGMFKSLGAVVTSLSEDKLSEFNSIKKLVTLIFNGKIPKIEDVMFEDVDNASFLIKQVGKNVDDVTRNYFELKIKQVLIKVRDDRKIELADLKKKTDDVRKTIQGI